MVDRLVTSWGRSQEADQRACWAESIMVRVADCYASKGLVGGATGVMLCRAVLQNFSPVMHQNYLVNSKHITV